MTYAEDKSKTNVKKLHNPERVKYEIHNDVKAVLKRCRTWEEFNEELKRRGIHLEFAFRRKNSRAVYDIQGLRFIKDGLTFKASDIGRQFSYAKLNEQLSWDKPKMQTEIEPKLQPIRQEEEHNYSITDSLIESNRLGLLNIPNAPTEEEQVPSWQKKKKDKKKKRRGIGL